MFRAACTSKEIKFPAANCCQCSCYLIKHMQWRTCGKRSIPSNSGCVRQTADARAVAHKLQHWKHSKHTFNTTYIWSAFSIEPGCDFEKVQRQVSALEFGECIWQTWQTAEWRLKNVPDMWKCLPDVDRWTGGTTLCHYGECRQTYSWEDALSAGSTEATLLM